MKFAAFLFSFYLLFLALEPGLKAMTVSKGKQTSCCSDSKCAPGEKGSSSDHHDEQENSNDCNPFQSCKCCSFITRDVTVAGSSPLTLFSNKHIAYKENIPPQISLDVWQPPKIA